MANRDEGSGVAPRRRRPTREPVGAYPVMNTVRALERLAFRSLSAPELAHAIQIHERTARRLLRRLAAEEYLTLGAGPRRRYQLTLRLAALGRQALAHTDWPRHAAPWVAALAAQSGIAPACGSRPTPTSCASSTPTPTARCRHRCSAHWRPRSAAPRQGPARPPRHLAQEPAHPTHPRPRRRRASRPA